MNAHHTVGVLTFHRCVNNGSYWQARCLVDVRRPVDTMRSPSITIHAG
jgi:hypothetical protein